MSWANKIIDAHRAVTDAVSHGQRLKSDRYFVWAEDGAAGLTADGRYAEPVITGSTDLFTKLEFDPWMRELGDSLSSHNIAWIMSYAEYEPDTGFWHYRWDWEVTD